MGIISTIKGAITDWSLVKKQKEGLLDALRQTPAGNCISIKDPANPITARAIIELLSENPNTLEAMDYGFEVTLMRKVAMVNSMSNDSYRTLRDNHNILSADSVAFFGLKGKAELPMRRFREGVDEKKVNGVTLDATEVNGQKVDPASRIIKG